MKYKKIYGTDVNISAIGLGTWPIGGQNYGHTEENECITTIHALLDMGLNHIDTAPGYGQGNAEGIVGKAIKDRRDKVILATKLDKGGAYDYAMQEVDKSLQRLDTDYIDIYYLHWPDPTVPISESITALKDMQKAGKIRYIGVSNFDINLLDEAMKVAKINFMEPPFSIVDQRQRERLEWCEAHEINVATYGSLGSGILTGHIRTIPNWGPTDPRRNFYDFYKEPKWSRCMELLTLLEKIAEDHQVPVSQVALNWNIQQSSVTTTLCSMTDLNQAEENCANFTWSLTDDELAAIDAEYKRLELDNLGMQKTVIKDESAENGFKIIFQDSVDGKEA